MNKNSKIYIAGHRGLVGSAIVKNLQSKGYTNLVYGKERAIATVDVQDLLIVDTGDALLVSKKGSSQKVKQAVAQIKKTTDLHHIHLTAMGNLYSA